MVGACINVAQSPEHKAVWQGKAPADFEADLTKLATDYGSVTVKAAQADAATGGAGDEKASAEAALEEAAYLLTRAVANHSKKMGNLDLRGKVDFSRTQIVKLRTQDLVTQTTAIRDLANGVVNEPDAAKRGVTPARIAALTAAITAYSPIMNKPRGQIVNRNALLKEIDTDIAALVEDVADMDDLAMQFDGDEAGRRFVEAWRGARVIVDAGGGRSTTPATPPSSTPTPAKPA